MCNVIISICTYIYWCKKCNVSRSTSFMKVFCRRLTHQSVNFFFALSKCHPSLMLENLHVRHSIFAVIRPAGIFLLHISGSVDYWFHVLVLYSTIITGPYRAGLYVVVYQWAYTLVWSQFCVCPFGVMSKVICDSWCLHFIIIIVVL